MQIFAHLEASLQHRKVLSLMSDAKMLTVTFTKMKVMCKQI